MNKKQAPSIACIFDMDGVLVDTAKYHFLSWVKLAEHLNFSLSSELDEELKGMSRMKSLDLVLNSGRISASDQEKIEYARLKNEWFLQSLVGIGDEVVLPGVIEFLQELKALQIPIAVGSASENPIFILKEVKMDHYFVSIVDGLMVRQTKPDPEVFLNAARDLQYPPAKIIVFEDSAKGLMAAKAGGFHTVGIGSPDVLQEADLVLPNLKGVGLEEITSVLGLE